MATGAPLPDPLQMSRTTYPGRGTPGASLIGVTVVVAGTIHRTTCGDRTDRS